MASNPSNLYRKYKDACDVYEYFDEKLLKNQLVVGDVYSFNQTKYEGVSALPVFDVVSTLLATKGLGLVLQVEPVGGVINQLAVTNTPVAPYVDSFEIQYLGWKDMVNLYDECVKIFGSKIFPVKVGQRFGFQQKYYYAVNNGLEYDTMVAQLCLQYSDNGLNAQNNTDYYTIV